MLTILRIQKCNVALHMKIKLNLFECKTEKHSFYRVTATRRIQFNSIIFIQLHTFITIYINIMKQYIIKVEREIISIIMLIVMMIPWQLFCFVTSAYAILYRNLNPEAWIWVPPSMRSCVVVIHGAVKMIGQWTVRDETEIVYCDIGKRKTSTKAPSVM